MRLPGDKSLRLGVMVVGALVVLGIAAAAWPHVGLPPVKDWSLKDWWKKPAPGSSSADAPHESSAELVPGKPDTLRLPPEVVKRLGVQTAKARRATETRPLELSGSLVLDPSHLARVHSRFPGEVVEIADAAGTSESSSPLKTVSRPLRYGDHVAKGQLLAVVWNTDLGNKKSDLVDAISQLRVDEQWLTAQTKVYNEGAASEATWRQAKRNVETDLNRVAAAERTLRVWRVPEEEIQAVKQEAARIVQRQGKRDPEKEKAWARVEVRAPFDGVIVEKNVAFGDIVDTSSDLFKVANLARLTVWAHVFEEDLPALQNLTPEQRKWKVRLQAEPTAPPLVGTIDVIGYVIDPNQHTAVVMGQVDNPEGRLRSGQFITAIVDLPPSPGEVALPTPALVEDGVTSVVFVQPDLDKPVFTQQQVAVARRGREVIHLRSHLRPEEEKKGIKALPPGTPIVTAGAVELKAALEDLQATAKQPK
jgi:cobalt-zinc-cadmium efflux system membrane fusion protein